MMLSCVLRSFSTFLLVAAANLVVLNDHAGAAIAQPSKLNINMAAIPLDKYQSWNWDATYSRTFVKNCSQTKTVRQCIQERLQHFRSQGAEGVRFFYPHCGGAYNTALNNCGALPSQVTLNQTWVNNLNLFLFDVKSKGFTKIIPSPGFTGAFEPTDPDPQNPANRNAPNDGQRKVTVDDPCPLNLSSTTPKKARLVFWPAAPYGVGGSDFYPGTSIAQPIGFWRPGENQSYNCSPPNPVFVGWNNIYAVAAAVLQKAQANGLVVEEFDLVNEIDIQTFTVMARLIVDNKHSSTGDPNVLTKFRSLMTASLFNPKRVVHSTSSTNTTVSAYSCGSVYGDSARIMSLSGMIAGISGGLIGLPKNPSVTNGLYCGGSTVDMIALMTYNSPPTITDVHVYPCVLGGVTGCQFPVASEATVTFNAIKSFLDSFGPGGWRGHVPDVYNSLFIVGETWSNSSVGSNSCEGNHNVGGNAAAQTVNGFNASNLAGRQAGTVFQPWHRLEYHYLPPSAPPPPVPPYPPPVLAPSACYPAAPTINPPYTPQP